MVEPVAGLAAQLLCFEPPHPRDAGGVDRWLIGKVL